MIHQLTAVRSDMLRLEIEGTARAANIHAINERSPRHLLHFPTLRRHDIRELQNRLAELGLSSLGRSESHVLDSVEILLRVLI